MAIFLRSLRMWQAAIMTAYTHSLTITLINPSLHGNELLTIAKQLKLIGAMNWRPDGRYIFLGFRPQLADLADAFWEKAKVGRLAEFLLPAR